MHVDKDEHPMTTNFPLIIPQCKAIIKNALPPATPSGNKTYPLRVRDYETIWGFCTRMLIYGTGSDATTKRCFDGNPTFGTVLSKNRHRINSTFRDRGALHARVPSDLQH